MKVLVAEDEAISRRLMRAQIERFGHEVIDVADGAQAWRALTGPDAPRLAVLDWNMPEIDGVALCRRLRERPSAPSTYVVLVTARQGREDLLAGLESGASDFLSKPVDPEELRARLQVGERLLLMEEEIRRSRAYLGAVLETIDSAVVLVDGQGKVAYVNPTAERLAGVMAERVTGRPRDEFLRAFAGRFADPKLFLSTVGIEGRPPEAPLGGPSSEDPLGLEMSWPERRMLRWIGQPVKLPERDGQGWLDVYRDVTSEVDLARGLAQAANTDHLTRLLNRRGAEKAIAREVSRAIRDRSPLAFALLDIDHFKKVNDQHGHAVGDLVLAAVSAVVEQTVRGYDLAVRWGGEELLVVLSGASLRQALPVVERIRVRIAEMRGDRLPSVTVSAGVAELGPGENSPESAIKRADEQLYKAKATGRNRVC